MRALVLTLIGLSPLACKGEEALDGSGCESCHRPADREGGLEEPHPLAAIKCTECHGGNAEETSIAGAHVANPTGGDIRNLSLAELGATNAAYRQFMNPSDPIAAMATCGTGSTCHQGIVDSVSRSVHATAAGILNVPRISMGLINEPKLAMLAVTDPAPGGGDNAFASFEAVSAPADVSTAASTEYKLFLEHTFSKACTGCHIQVYGAQGPGRSGNLIPNGCATCHSPYAPDALGTSNDPTVNRTEPGHPLRHAIESVVADSQCETCHYRSLRIGTQFRGLREITKSDLDRGTDNMKLYPEPLHGHPAGFYVEDDDTRDSLDTTPADIHQQKGLGCVDCHLGTDIHGDGHLRGTQGPSLGIECSDCHGTFEREAAMDGNFKTTGGAVLARIRREGDRVIMVGALDKKDHPVTQVTNLKRTPLVTNAHSEARHGDLECYSCHTAWMQNFYLAERTLDLRVSEKNGLDGQSSVGVVTETNLIVEDEVVHLGVNDDGKIGTFMFDNTLLSVIASCDPRTEPVGCEQSGSPPVFGKKIIDKYLTKLPGNKVSLGYFPAFAHTTANRGHIQPCERCHPRQYEVDPGRPAAAFGRGSAKYFQTLTGTTATVDLTKVVDALGGPIVPFPHPGTKPVPQAAVGAALDYEVILPLR